MTSNNFTPLAWYDSPEDQSFRKPYAYGSVYPLYVPKGLIPFQIIEKVSSSTPVQYLHFYLYTVDDEYVGELPQGDMLFNGLWSSQNGDYAVISYTASQNSLRPLVDKIGQYYLLMEDESVGIEYYSEAFTVVNSVAPYIKLEWWDIDDLVFDAGMIDYHHSYVNRVYLCSEIAMPEYTFDEQGEDRGGYFFANSQLSEKTYRLSFLAPEYLCDALRVVQLSDYIRITDQYRNVYMADTFSLSPEWQPQGYLAAVQAEFQTNTVIRKLGLAYWREQQQEQQ